jgi:hydrogenase-4 component B
LSCVIVPAFIVLLVWQTSMNAGSGGLAPAWALGMAVLVLAAFGTKAGLFPFLVWLPFAEPEADGDTAGLLSGLLTAVAMAGFLHLVQMLAPDRTALGVITGTLGLAGAVYGALMGFVERDAKRVLAYGTVEALGLCFTGFGLGWFLSGQGAGNSAVLAVAGAWTLLLAHAGAKYALFVLAGHVEQAGGLRRLDAMGGLLRRVRRGGPPALVAVLVLAGLPPFGGFLGEWLILEACLLPTPADPALHIVLAFVAAVLALIGAAALTLYLRWFGIMWLGQARSERAGSCPEAPAGTTASGEEPGSPPAGCCLGWVSRPPGSPPGRPSSHRPTSTQSRTLRSSRSVRRYSAAWRAARETFSSRPAASPSTHPGIWRCSSRWWEESSP